MVTVKAAAIATADKNKQITFSQRTDDKWTMAPRIQGFFPQWIFLFRQAVSLCLLRLRRVERDIQLPRISACTYYKLSH